MKVFKDTYGIIKSLDVGSNRHSTDRIVTCSGLVDLCSVPTSYVNMATCVLVVKP